MNPLSGGPTGSDLLGSNLVIIAIFLWIPLALKRPKRDSINKIFQWVCFIYILHWGLFLCLQHGNVPNDSLSQLCSLWSIVIWIPILHCFYSKFRWNPISVHWLKDMLVWGTILIIQASLCFNPAVLEKFKFTNVWVGHSHLAMAGLVSSFNFVILGNFNRKNTCIYDSIDFYVWNYALAGYIVLVCIAGFYEFNVPYILYYPNAQIQFLYLLRLLCGILMFFISLRISFRTYHRGLNFEDSKLTLMRMTDCVEQKC